MGVSAQVVDIGKPGLTLKVDLNGEDETKFRQMADLINDQSDCSLCLQQILQIAYDAVQMVAQHKEKVF